MNRNDITLRKEYEAMDHVSRTGAYGLRGMVTVPSNAAIRPCKDPCAVCKKMGRQ